MSVLTEKAYAKINLGLNILGKRPDGYHEVAMIMQSVGLADTITLQPAEELQVTCNLAGLSCDQSNLATRAALLLAKEAGLKPQVRIHLEKKIFLAAGLAGGSTDAAAVLRGLNKFWGLGYNNDRLRYLAAQLGSDVPFCIEGGTALATGRGERIKALPDLPETFCVLAKPRGVEVSTAWVYTHYDPHRVVRIPNIYALQEHVSEGGMKLRPFLGNVLETVTIPKLPLLASLKADMLAAGAYYAMMSGSGPTVFALAENQEIAEKIMERLADFDVETALTTTVRRI